MSAVSRDGLVAYSRVFVRLRIERITSSTLRYCHSKVDIESYPCDPHPRIFLISTGEISIVMMVMSMTM